MKRLPKEQKIYLIIIYILTIVGVLYAIHNGYMETDFIHYYDIVLFIFLIALTESFTVVFKNISFSTSFAITIAAYIIFGPLTCIVVVAIGFLCRVLNVKERGYIHIFNTPVYGTMFNCCALILPIIISNYFYILIGGSFGINNLGKNVLPMIMFVLIYLIVNILMMSILMSIRIKKNVLFCFVGNIKIGFLNSIVMLPIGILLAVIFTKYSYWGLAFIIFPIALVRYTILLYSNTKTQFIETVGALMNAIDARDMYTEGHSRRVAEISHEIAKELKFNDFKIEQLNIAAMLHDVGKIGISDNILNKPDKLTEEEYNIIKEHPSIGIKIIKEIKNIDYVHNIVEHHHERYDGKGYPHGLKGDELPISVYVVQLADAVDAMCSDRPYRKGLPKEIIKAEIAKYSGTQFHPEVAEAYLNILNREIKRLEAQRPKANLIKEENTVTQ